MLNAAIAIKSQCHKSEDLSSSCPQLLCAFRRERWGRMDALGLSSCKLSAKEAETDAGRSWGYTWRDGCRQSRESGLSHGFVRTDLQAAVHLHLASWAGLYTQPASTHTHSHSHRQGRESVACVPQRLCPANTAELSAVAVATRQQGCSVSSALRTLLIPKPLPASKTLHLSVFPLYSFGAFPEQSQTNLHVLTFKIPS